MSANEEALEACSIIASGLQNSSNIPSTNCLCNNETVKVGGFTVACHYDEVCGDACGGTACIDRMDNFTYDWFNDTSDQNQTGWRNIGRDFANTYSGDSVYWTYRGILSDFVVGTCLAFWYDANETLVPCKSCRTCPGTSEVLTDCSNLQFQAKEPGCGIRTPQEMRIDVCVGNITSNISDPVDTSDGSSRSLMLALWVGALVCSLKTLF